jgi:hypothetical protein
LAPEEDWIVPDTRHIQSENYHQSEFHAGCCSSEILEEVKKEEMEEEEEGKIASSLDLNYEYHKVAKLRSIRVIGLVTS